MNGEGRMGEEIGGQARKALHDHTQSTCTAWVVTGSSTTMYVSVLGQSLNLLSSILTILLTCPNSDTLLCYNNDPFLTA